MNKLKSHLPLLSKSIFVSALLLLINYLIKIYDKSLYLNATVLILAFTIINIIIIELLIHKANNLKQYIRVFMILFVVKFFIYAGISTLFIYSNKNYLVLSVIYLAVIYLVFTTIELFEILSFRSDTIE